MARPLLTACLIVRNEAPRLPRCLDSLRGVADEVIVVDTGSTDETVEIARSYGAIVRHFPWADDFAAARNVSIANARGKWILYIDADEELLDHGLRRSLKGGNVGCLVLRLTSIQDDGQPMGQGWQPRLLLNEPGLHFAGKIHEHPEVRRPGGPTAGAEIIHWGYSQSDGRTAEKHERNLRLLQAAVSSYPNEPYYLWQLGMEDSKEERWQEAWEAFDRALEVWADKGGKLIKWGGSLFAHSIHVLTVLGRFDEAVELAKATPELYLTSDIFLNLGNTFMLSGAPQLAEEAFRKASECTFELQLEHDPASRTWRPLLGLATLALLTGQNLKALSLLRKAMEFAPNEPVLKEAFNIANHPRELFVAA